MRTILRLLLLFILFSILFVLPGILIPISVAVEDNSVNGAMFFLILITDFAAIMYLITRLKLFGWGLVAATVLVFWGMQTFMTQIETWYFREAMLRISNRELLNLFLRPLITAITFIPLATLVLKKWRPSEGDYAMQIRPITKWKEISVLSIAYMIVYFVFGYYVAWQFEEVRIFYSGSSAKLGFIEQLQHPLSTMNFLLVFQILRGLLWTMIVLPVVMYLKGNKTEKIIASILLYSLLPSIQLVIDNPFMPESVRFAHLLEVSSSNGLFGLLFGLLMTRK